MKKLRPKKPGAENESVYLGKVKIEVEYDPGYGQWRARMKPSLENLWFGDHLCFANTREQAIEKAREVLRQKKLKETVEVEL